MTLKSIALAAALISLATLVQAQPDLAASAAQEKGAVVTDRKSVV